LTPEAIAKAIASGKATMPTMSPATAFLRMFPPVKSPARRASRNAIMSEKQS
jgi:hypothetical protein